MRVLHLGKFWPPHPGGMERHSAELVAALAREGVEPAVLVHASPGQRYSPRQDAGGIRVEAARCHGQLVFAPLSPGWPLRLARLLREFRPELLHLHLPNPSTFWMLGMPAARRIPWLLHWHAEVPHDAAQLGLRLGYPVYRRFEHALLRQARCVVTTSAAYRDASRTLEPFARKTQVIPLGLPDAPAAATSPDWPGAGLRLLAVGRLSYYKGFEVLLDAVARVPDVSLLLIGDGEQRTALEARVRSLGLAPRVRLASGVDDAALEAAYRACDLFCLSSIDRAEAFGMVLLEAMRAARPVVATAIPGSGTGSVVVDGETGRLVPPRDVEALAAALRSLARDAELRARYGAAGRARWEREYRIEAISRRWASLYREVLQTPPTAG